MQHGNLNRDKNSLQEGVVFSGEENKYGKKKNGESQSMKLSDGERREAREEGYREGIKESVKEGVKEEETGKRKLNELIQKSRKPLFEMSTIFPFDLFPDKLSIELDRVNIYHRNFLETGEVRGIAMSNIGEVVIGLSPFLTTLRIIEERIGPESTHTFKPVWKEDAVKARRIITGLIIANKEGIELTIFKPEELAKKAEDLGKSQEPDVLQN
jgi:hypothetical protein